MIAYCNGRFLPVGEIAISPDDRGFLFADGLYEVIRSYRGKLFQAQAHVDRLSRGARAIRLNVSDFGYVVAVAERLIRENALQGDDAIVYLQVTRGVAARAHPFPPASTPLTVYAAARVYPSRMEEQEKGIGVILVPDQRWARCDIKSVGLLPNVLAQQRALDCNASEALFVRAGAVLEGTHTNFLAVLGETVVTPPKTNYILSGITRQIVLDLCARLSIPVVERSIFESELDRAQELMVVGTTTEITPVVEVNGRRIGSGKPGPVTRRLQEAFFAECRRI